jgi:hypothetical protein
MLGSASTQQLFASANSIGVIPQVWGEWNYNSFIQPSITTSGSASELIDTLSLPLNEVTSWTKNSDGIINAKSSDGRNTDVNSSGSSISLVIADSSSSANFYVSATSPFSTLTSSDNNGYYKLSFYVKVGNLVSTSGTPDIVSGSSVSISTNGSGSIPYYYRIVSIGSDGQTFGPDTINNYDSASILSSTTATHTLIWNDVNNATAYKIYRANNLGEILFLDAVTTASYKDYQTKTPQYLDNDFFNTNINLVPSIELHNDDQETVAVYQTCKVFESTNANPSKLSNTIDVNCERWQKVEMCFGVNESDTNNYFSKFALNLDISAKHQGAELLVTDFSLYKITEFDFRNQHLFPTQSAFLPTRPGEALLHPLIPYSDTRVRRRGNENAKPVSFLTRSTNDIGESTFPVYTAVPDEDNKFKLYISSKWESEPSSLQAIYDTYLSVNKIVIKLDQSYASFNAGSLRIYSGSSNSVTAVTLSASDFDAHGIAVLYYNGSSWSTTSWSRPPTLNSDGTLGNLVKDQVRELRLIATSLSDGNVYKSDSRLRVIELSPRLELDLSNYVTQVSCKKDLVSTQSSGLPFSYISANSGTIDFSNIPSYRSDNFGATTFENSSKKSAFYNLMRQGVKFTALLEPSSYETNLKETIPLFVMYSDSWTISDLDSVSVELYDISKLFMMGSDSMHYFAYDTNVVSVIKELLDYSGFSDYDYNGLYQLPEINAKVSGFWTDEQKTVFTNLQEFLLPNQIAASIDEYGILRFDSISQVFNKFGSKNFAADFAITDHLVTGIGSSSSNYIANIIPDSFSENISQKIGSIVVNYKTPLTFRSNVDKKNTATSLIKPKVNTVDAPHSVWKMKESDGLSQFFLNKSVLSTDDSLSVPIGSITTVKNADKTITTKIVNEGSFVGSRRTPAKMSGDLIIGSEIVGYSGIEYVIVDSANKANSVTKTIYDLSDLDSAISDFQIYNTEKPFGSTSSVQFAPTGRLMNLVRGKYGTTPESHIVPTVIAETPFRFFSAMPGNSVLNNIKVYKATQSIGKHKEAPQGILKISTSYTNSLSIAQVKTKKQSDFDFFSLNFAVDEGGGNNVTGYINTTTQEQISISAYSKLTQHQKTKYKKKKELRPNDSAFGMIFNTASAAGVTQTGALCIEIQQITGSGDTTNKIVAYKLSNPSDLLINEKIDFSKFYGHNAYSPNLFDGDPHSFNVFFHGKDIVVSIDGYTKKYDLAGAKTFTPAQKLSFGAYIRPLESSAQTLLIYELYAANYKEKDLDHNVNRHFTSMRYLNSLVEKVHEPYSYFQYASPPLARGINFYDVKLESAPIFTQAPKTVTIQKIAYNNPGSDWTTLQPVKKTDISYSTPKGSAFQQKFVLAHDGPIGQGLIILNTGDSQSGDISTSLNLLANNMYLSEQKTLTRVIDSNYTNNTISLTMDWARDIIQVEKTLSNIIRANSGFNIDYSIRVFGNPLIQAGDFGQITYNLKRLGSDPSDSSITPLVGLITSVKSTYSGGLDSTELTFKPMIIS